MVSRRGRLGELAKSFDLRALTERVLAGALSLEAARAEIAAMNAARVADARPLEQLPDGTLLVLAKVQEDIDALVQELAREEKATRVHDLGVLVCDAAPLLTPGYIIFPCVVVAQRLITLDRAAWAFEFLDRADPVASVPSEGYSRLQTLRTECLLNLGKGTEAAATIAPVIDYARAESKTGLLVEALMRLGRALSVSGRVDRALAAAREAAAVFDSPGYEPLRWSGAVKSWEIHGLIAHTERALGHFEEALSAYERARADALAAGNVGGAAFFLSEVGYTWQVAGDLERGREILNRAAGEAYELGALGFAARWSGTMPPPPLEANEPPLDKATRAITLMKSTPPRLDEARKLLISAIEPAVGGGDKLVELVVRTALTNLYVEQGKYMQAEIAALEAIEVAHEMGNVGAELRARLNLAHVHVQRKRRADAEAVLEEAVALGERVRTTARSAEMRQTIGAVLAEGYEWLAFLAGIQYAANADAEWEPVRPARLFELGQRTRALNLARWINWASASGRWARRHGRRCSICSPRKCSWNRWRKRDVDVSTMPWRSGTGRRNACTRPQESRSNSRRRRCR